ncbi:hypothetical protein CCAND38_420061 [Capnocytophaga canis]|uniref:Uncharacterized protein n=1 Tax=Capnocytophaga canis TaxID=1848903 RepID=A0A0B7I6C1_9FLAO|nr:hypothetical protein CCAND38_420061 [Capnocytophaga canis]
MNLYVFFYINTTFIFIKSKQTKLKNQLIIDFQHLTSLENFDKALKLCQSFLFFYKIWNLLPDNPS